MQNYLRELNLTYALIYLDDVIVYSHMEDDHLTWLRAVFERFQKLLLYRDQLLGT